MVFKHARFAIHYRDGSVLIEDRNDPHSWDNAPKVNMYTVSILFDAPYHGELSTMLQPSHNGVNRFFQFKTKVLRLKKESHDYESARSLSIGRVNDPYGNCTIKEATIIDEEGEDIFNPNRPQKPHIRKYHTNVHDIKLNLKLFGIDVSKCEQE